MHSKLHSKVISLDCLVDAYDLGLRVGNPSSQRRTYRRCRFDTYRGALTSTKPMSHRHSVVTIQRIVVQTVRQGLKMTTYRAPWHIRRRSGQTIVARLLSNNRHFATCHKLGELSGRGGGFNGQRPRPAVPYCLVSASTAWPARNIAPS